MSKHVCKAPTAGPSSAEVDKMVYYCPFPCLRRWVWTRRGGWR
jgi:hypothetical protein